MALSLFYCSSARGLHNSLLYLTRVRDDVRVLVGCALFWEHGCNRDIWGQGYGMGEGAGTQGQSGTGGADESLLFGIWPDKARGILSDGVDLENH